MDRKSLRLSWVSCRPSFSFPCARRRDCSAACSWRSWSPHTGPESCSRASGAYGMDPTRARTDKLLALVNVEGNCAPVTAEEVSKVFVKVPLLAVLGRQSHGVPGPNGGKEFLFTFDLDQAGYPGFRLRIIGLCRQVANPRRSMG